MSEYEKQANDLLKSMNVGFKAEFVKYGSHFEGETEKRDIYKCVFSRGDDNLVIEFGQSIVNSGKGIPPTAYDVITCMEKYDPEDFDFWCDNLGFDNDSRRAERIYKLCVKQWRQVSGFFTEEELEELREVQ